MKKMRFFLSKHKIRFLVLLLAALLPYFFLCFFTQPIGEDFGFSARYQNNPFFYLLITSYKKMNGRYISTITMYLSPLSISSGNYLGYKLAPFFMLLLTCLGNYFLISGLFKKVSKTNQLIFSLLLSLIFLHGLPTISEGLYWYTAASIYQLGIIAMLFYEALFIRIIAKKTSWVRYVLFTLLLMISCGFNETQTLLICWILFIKVVIFYKNNLKRKKHVMVQFLFALSFATVMIFAPGNGYRDGMYLNNHNFSHSTYYSLLQIGRFSLTWVLSIPIIIISLLYVVFHEKVIKNIPLAKHSFYLTRWVSVLILCTIILIAVFPPYWFTGILGQHRTLNVAYAFFLIAWFINLTVWINHYQFHQKLKTWKKQKKILLTLLFLGIVFTGNGYSALTDILSGKAMRFNNQLAHRHQVLSQSVKKQSKKIVFQPIKDRPKTLFVTDIDSDPNFWINQGYNDYFNLKSTKIYITIAD